MRGANQRGIGLNVPVELCKRQITATAFPIGIETTGISYLLTWLACLRAVAKLLTELKLAGSD
jgi:hypothetical protein